MWNYAPAAAVGLNQRKRHNEPVIRGTNEGENEAGYSAGARRNSGLSGQNGHGWEYSGNIYDNSAEDYDPDLYRAAILQRYIRGEAGLKNQVESYAGAYNPDVARTAMNSLLARAGQRKEMKSQVAGLGAVQAKDEQLQVRDAEQAIGEGVKNTRTNFNQRGLLYGGMREGGETQVKAQGAATLSNNLANTKRDYANQADAQKKAIAALGLASQQEAIQRANQVMETNMRNQVARQQAYQQLGEGVGYAAGAYYGGQQKAPTGAPSTGGYSPSMQSGSRQPVISGAAY